MSRRTLFATYRIECLEVRRETVRMNGMTARLNEQRTKMIIVLTEISDVLERREEHGLSVHGSRDHHTGCPLI